MLKTSCYDNVIWRIELFLFILQLGTVSYLEWLSLRPYRVPNDLDFSSLSSCTQWCAIKYCVWNIGSVPRRWCWKISLIKYYVHHNEIQLIIHYYIPCYHCDNLAIKLNCYPSLFMDLERLKLCLIFYADQMMSIISLTTKYQLVLVSGLHIMTQNLGFKYTEL